MSSRHLKQGFYHTELVSTSWDVPIRYKRLSPIGSGAYGQVCASDDDVIKTRVAVKKLARPFQSDTFAKRAYREILMLKHFDHENLINLLDIFTPNESLANFSEVYLVTPFMDADLHDILKCQTLQEEHVQFLLYQILRGLKCIHSAGIIHRDLKPNNIGVNKTVELRILDFGLARPSATEMTGYVVCRWYRAPEIILNWMHYNNKVDIWSVGCIFGEMLTRKPLFKGFDHIDQLTKILTLVGTPSEQFIGRIASHEARRYIRRLPEYQKKDYKVYFGNNNSLAIDLLEKMLDLDPETRISVDEALRHPYMANYHDPTDEPTSEPFDNSFEALGLNADGWRKRVYQEIVSFKSQPFESQTL